MAGRPQSGICGQKYMKMRCVLLKFPQEECDLRCSYCYLHSRPSHGISWFLERHTPEVIADALAPDRMGGVCFFYGYADGEPLLHAVNIKILAALAARGHFAAVTTNLNSDGVLRLEKEVPVQDRWRVLILASLHYWELCRGNRLDRFFDHLSRLREAGFWCRIRLCLAPEYLPALDEIDELCKRRTGQLPLLTRWRGPGTSDPEMEALDRVGMRSPVYRLQKQCADVKRREFCLAGAKSAVLDLGDGTVRACLAEPCRGLFDPTDPDTVRFFLGEPVGRECHARWCMCCSLLLPWGVIPELDPGSWGDLFFDPQDSTIDPRLKQALSDSRRVHGPTGQKSSEDLP